MGEGEWRGGEGAGVGGGCFPRGPRPPSLAGVNIMAIMFIMKKAFLDGRTSVTLFPPNQR